MKTLLLLSLIQCVFLAFSQTEKTHENTDHEIGFFSGFGNQEIINVGYTYEIVFLQLHYGKKVLERDNYQLELISLPQINFTSFFDSNDKPVNSYEFGISSGGLFRYFLKEKKYSVYVLIASGPHYVSKTPSRQRAGFNFSNNFHIGMDIKISEKWRVDFRPGFRHVSNFVVAKPNRGLNNVEILVGLIYNL